MKYVKMLGLAAVAAMALMAFLGAGTASATVLCTAPNKEDVCPAGEKYEAGKTIHATTTPGTTAVLETTGGVVLDTCTGSTVKGVAETTGSASTTVSGAIGELAWGTCSRTTHTLKIGSLEVHHIPGTNNGTLTASGGTEVTILTIFGTCTYGTGATLDIGKVTGGNTAVIHTEKTVVPKLAGNAACPAHGVWNASFDVTEPSPLYIAAS